MTQHVLIGVGGSGQHVVHAYLRLLTLTSPQTKNVPHVFILDADARVGTGADKRSTLIDDIVDLHRFLVSGDATSACCQILRPFRKTSSGDPGSQVLGELIGVADNSALAALANGFLTDDVHEWGNDWTIELSKGMMANPKVGSIALAHKVEGAAGETGASKSAEPEPPQFGRLFSVLNNEGTRVAITGSNFGGTGSGVIPALVRQLDTRPGIDAVRAFMCLPWFSIEPGDSGERTSAARDRDGVDPRARNSSLGLHTYYDELSGSGRLGKPRLKKSTYVLSQSMPQWPQEKRLDDGNFDQRENRHVLNLVQANAIQAFLGLGSVKGGAPHGSLYGIKTTAPAELRGQFDAARSPHMRFWAGANDSRQLVDLVADAEATAFALEKGGRVLATADDGSLQLKGVTNKLRDQPGLDRFAIAVSESLGKGSVKRGWFPKRETAPDEVFKQLGAAMIDLANQMRSSLVWIDGHCVARAGAEADFVSGVTGCTSNHLFGAPEFGNTKQRLTDIDNNERLQDAWKALALVVTNLSGQNMAGAPPVSQGFALFNALFAPGSTKAGGIDPVDGLIAEFSEERKVSKTDAGTTVAARVIGSSLHRLVFAARNEVRSKDSVLDDRQRSREVESGGGVPMLSLDPGLTGTPVDDCRLVEVKLNEEKNDKADPFSPSHPMSLAYIDPYGGLTLNNANQLSFAGYSFPEHGLRGIPNIAAPQLLQKWRIEKCRPRTDEEREAAFFTEHDGRLRATKAGIYLHARRINEAALWLIVSADSRVEFVPDLFNESNRSSAFARLLQKELALSANERLPALVFNPNPDSANAGKPIFMWSGETWYLAANSAARTFFGSLIAELPSVRYRYRSDNPLIRLDSPNASASKALDAFFAQQIQGAIASIDASGLTRDGATHEPAAALRDALSKTLDDLPKSKANEDYRGESRGLWLRSSNNAHAELTVAPHKMASKLQSFYCDPAVVFVDGKGGPNGLLPLTAQAWQMMKGGKADNRLVLAPSGTTKVDAQSLALRKVQQIQLTVTGLGQLDQDFPFGNAPLHEIQQELAWSLGVWPNFRAENWNYYIISGMARLGDPDNVTKTKAKRVNLEWMNESLEVALVVWGKRAGGKPADPMEKLGEVTHGLPQRINGVPEVLEVVVGGRVLGSRRIELETADGKNSVDMIGVDFGTSNTCVAVRQKEEKPDSSPTVPLLPGGSFDESAVAPMLYYIDSSGEPEVRDLPGEPLLRDTFLASAAGFFHVRNSNVVGDAGDTIPTELLVSLHDSPVVAKRQKARLHEAYDKDDKPYVGIGGGERPLSLGDYPLASPLFTPLPPQPHGLEADEVFFAWLREVVRMGDERLLGDLKWPRGNDDADIQKSSALRALYLEHAIVVALAVLRRSGYSEFGRFVATQPEAISQAKDHFANTFGPDLVSIVSALSARTGMSWLHRASKDNPKARSDVFLVSETVAALHMAGFSEKKLPNSVLTIDVGGGTTDVGVCLRYGRSGKQQSHTASARFAGNKLLEALAQSRGVRDFFSRGGEQYSPDALKSLLKSELRRKSGPGIRTEQTGRLADMFFDAIYEYAFKALHLFMQVNPDWAKQFIADPEQVLKIVLLGNGFRLYEAFQAAGSGETMDRYNKEILKRLVAAQLLPEEAVAKKKVVFVRPATPKSGLISIGGLDAARMNDLFEEERRMVLLPKGLASQDREGNTKLLDMPALIELREFRKQWLGLEQSGQPRELSLELSNEAMKDQFPLTYPYWTAGKEDRRDDLQNVFRSSPEFAPLYMDAAGLYLTGVPLGAGRSFGWLMAEHAKEGS